MNQMQHDKVDTLESHADMHYLMAKHQHELHIKLYSAVVLLK